MRKCSWNMITAIAAVVGVFVYSLQTFYMYRALKNASGSMELEFHSTLSKAEAELYKNPEAHEFYNNLGLGGVKLTYAEIYNYLNILEAASVLFLSGKIDKENFFSLYEGAINSAARVLSRSSDKNHYPSILHLAKLFEEQKGSQ